MLIFGEGREHRARECRRGVYVWQGFRRMTREQARGDIPAFRPVWADADPVLLA